MHRPLVLACVTLMFVVVGSALARTPGDTMKSYGAWKIGCKMSGHSKLCVMLQIARLKGKPFSQIQIGPPNKKAGMLFQFRVPNNVWLSAGVKLTTEHENITARFIFCDPGGCIADSFVSESVIDALGRLQTNGKLQFKDANKHDIAVPVSFKGFGAAYKVLRVQK